MHLPVLFAWLCSLLEAYAQDDPKVKIDESNTQYEFFTFVTRPELKVPRWDVTIYDQARLSPGYWFTSPYGKLEQTKAGALWNAPYIYDSDGELIWSGGHLFEHWSTFDFRVANILGKDMLSVINYHEGKTYLLDGSYSVQKKIDMAKTNMHEFAMVQDGTRALHLFHEGAYASMANSRKIGYNGECFVDLEGFKELDARTWEPVVEWTATQDHIGLDESYAHNGSVGEYCAQAEPWEYLHLNSVDKFPDGDYLLSARHTSAIYKVSHVDGSIVWRFGGLNSDFVGDINFSGQHSARVRSQNESHTTIAFFDNAWYQEYIQPTYSMSRGVLVSLSTTSSPMLAENLLTFDSPDNDEIWTKARGNMEILPNGNAFAGWAHRSMHSEHSGIDGKLLMMAAFRAEIDSYRSFKSPWVGHPIQAPDVQATATMEGTTVHVSWNGATEVAQWRFWSASAEGELLELLAETRRQGFETSINIKSSPGLIVAEAVDQAATSIGMSEVIQVVAEDREQLGDAVTSLQPHHWSNELLHDRTTAAFLVGVIFAACGLTLVWVTSRLKRRPRRSFATPWDQVEMSYEPPTKGRRDD